MNTLARTLPILIASLHALVATAQDAAPADRNAVNTRARPGGMMADSPVAFPRQGALPAKYPPDVKERAEPSEKDYYIFSTPCRSLAQIERIQAEMPYGQFHVPPTDWKHLTRTHRILTKGGDLRLLALGDSIVNDTMRSGWVAKLQEAYPKARIEARVFVRGGGGCQHYREDGRVERYILPWKPDLVYIGGISQKDITSIREVIRQLRTGLPEVEILLATGTFGTADPRDPEALAKAPHSGTGTYGEALKALAAEQRCAYLEMTGPWAEYIRSSKRHPHVFYRDVVHANEFGEQILARIMMAFFGPADARRAASSQAPWPQRSLEPPVLLPDSSEFTTWEPAALRFTRTYHVNASNPDASDENPGTEARPFATLNRAAQVLLPGERVLVGPGIYRERIRPARGGTSPSQMISYEAQPGAQVILRGSRVFLGSWVRRQGAETNVWSARLVPKLFDGYQPFDLPNVTEKQFESMDWAHSQRGKLPFTLVRGLVFQDGRRLAQVADLAALSTNEGAFWVDRTNQVLHVRFLQDADPARALIEVTTQETIFAPEQPGLGFIRVKGFVVEHAAGPFPWEQVGAISPTRGHHWIIEDCTVRQVNGVGLDLGIQHPRWPQPPQVGFHIVRRNLVTDCGICGICGLGPGGGRETGLLIEDNVVLRNAWHNAELLWETGGIKTHCNVRCLIRRNLVADTPHGSGIWLDWDNRGSRCCQNIVVASHTKNGAIFVEASTEPNLVDHNIVWDTAGHGIYEHDSRRQIFAHNLVGRSSGEAFQLHGKITDRQVHGEPMTYGNHLVANNLILGNAKPDEFRGEPSVVTNPLALADGIRLNQDTLELRIEEVPVLEREPVYVAPITHDLFSRERSRTPAAVGPFAATPAKGSVVQLRSAAMPADTEAWLGQRLEWFQDLKFGFMMHWAPYSQWGSIESWPLVEEDKFGRPDDLKAWTERGKDMARFTRDYWALPKTFNPVKFDPRKWAKAAKDAGMKYVVFTTKHHDGFAMFNTRLSDYRITAPDVPFHANPRSNVVREVFNAFRQDRFAIGAYFSKADWHCPDYWDPSQPAKTRNPNYDPLARPEKWSKFVDFAHGQVAELMTGYGPIDILWLDAGQVRPPQQDLQMDRLVAMARQHQPGLIVVDRTVGGRYENYPTPEQEVPDTPLPYVWETCMTMGNQWSFKPDDQYKSTHRLIHLLVDVVGKGGNFLLNVGPQPDGRLPGAAVQRMREIGDWLDVNGEAIYGTRPIAPYKDGNVIFTRKGNVA
ncbi:MAG: alpha-L-fucosidase [Verrucomicrobiia bacterium]